MGCNPAPPLSPMGLWLGDCLTLQSVTRSQLICTGHLLSFLEVTTLAQMGRGPGIWARLTIAAAASQGCLRM